MKPHGMKTLWALAAATLLFSCGATNTSAVSSQSLASESTLSPSSNVTSEQPSESSSSSKSDSSIVSSSEQSSTDESSELESSQSSLSTVEESSEQSASISSSAESSSSLAGKDGNGVAYDATAFAIARSSDGLIPAFSEGVYTIDQGGEYDLSGTLLGMIYINVAETDNGTGEVVLNFNGVDISYAGNSTIYCLSAGKLEISAKKGTENSLLDLRAVKAEDDETQGGGTLYSKVDTKLKGTGSLSVKGTYNNGIHVTKDLEIQKLTLSSTAINNAIKGNDSLTINSGTITAISSGGDGLKTEDSDISSKGKQRGDITILGGSVDIYSACDGIQAAHDFILGAEDSTASPSVTIHTNKYSSYTNEDDISSASSEKMYLRTTSNYTSYRFSCYFYNDSSDNGVWADASYLESRQFGGGTYYYYDLERPVNYGSFTVYAFNSSAGNSKENYVAKSSGNTVNSNYDTVQFSVNPSSKNISLNGWSNYNAGGGGFGPGGGGFGPGGGGFGPGGGGFGPGGAEGNSDKADVSAKGVKALNDLYILSGLIDVTAYDDGLHARNGEALESGETSTGDVYIKGGEVRVSCSDDGVHADRKLTISGGLVQVTNSYEGLEGNQIYLTGGSSYVYASDDGVNAGSGSLSPLIDVSGGYLFAAVPSSGDTDGIDSNGNYVQSGGTVIVAGPGRAGGAAALDTDGSVTISGGTLAVFGTCEKTPSLGSGVTKSSKSGTYSNKAYTIAFSNGSVETGVLPSSSYSGLNCFSTLGSVTSIA